MIARGVDRQEWCRREVEKEAERDKCGGRERRERGRERETSVVEERGRERGRERQRDKCGGER